MGGYYYVIYAVTNAVSVGIAWHWYPETAGLSLEGRCLPSRRRQMKLTPALGKTGVDRLFEGPNVIRRRDINTMLDYGFGVENDSVERGKELNSTEKRV